VEIEVIFGGVVEVSEEFVGIPVEISGSRKKSSGKLKEFQWKFGILSEFQ
jgi:hypothetical protein